MAFAADENSKLLSPIGMAGRQATFSIDVRPDTWEATGVLQDAAIGALAA